METKYRCKWLNLQGLDKGAGNTKNYNHKGYYKMNDLIREYEVRLKQLLRGSKELYKGELQVIRQILGKV